MAGQLMETVKGILLYELVNQKGMSKFVLPDIENYLNTRQTSLVGLSIQNKVYNIPSHMTLPCENVIFKLLETL